MKRGEKMRDKTSLGSFIAMRRKYMRLTQEQLANKIGVSKSAIAKWETDRGIPDRDNLGSLAHIINVSVDELHRLIKKGDLNRIDLNVNITPDVIETLESYGYTVIRPDDVNKNKKGV